MSAGEQVSPLLQVAGVWVAGRHLGAVSDYGQTHRSFCSGRPRYYEYPPPWSWVRCARILLVVPAWYAGAAAVCAYVYVDKPSAALDALCGLRALRACSLS